MEISSLPFQKFYYMTKNLYYLLWAIICGMVWAAFSQGGFFSWFESLFEKGDFFDSFKSWASIILFAGFFFLVVIPLYLSPWAAILLLLALGNYRDDDISLFLMMVYVGCLFIGLGLMLLSVPVMVLEALFLQGLPPLYGVIM